jgi:hypothetical protein
MRSGFLAMPRRRTRTAPQTPPPGKRSCSALSLLPASTYPMSLAPKCVTKPELGNEAENEESGKSGGGKASEPFLLSCVPHSTPFLFVIFLRLLRLFAAIPLRRSSFRLY